VAVPLVNGKLAELAELLIGGGMTVALLALLVTGRGTTVIVLRTTTGLGLEAEAGWTGVETSAISPAALDVVAGAASVTVTVEAGTVTVTVTGVHAPPNAVPEDTAPPTPAAVLEAAMTVMYLVEVQVEVRVVVGLSTSPSAVLVIIPLGSSVLPGRVA
jgi:hypothetical protein